MDIKLVLSTHLMLLEINTLEHGIIHLPNKRKKNIVTGTPIYIVQTKVSKIVLDIIVQDQLK